MNVFYEIILLNREWYRHMSRANRIQSGVLMSLLSVMARHSRYFSNEHCRFVIKKLRENYGKKQVIDDKHLQIRY